MEPKVVIEKFLHAEISNQDLYEELFYFINSFHIRKGEFEGNEYIVKKIDHMNFIIFPEYEYSDGHKEIPFSVALYKQDLLADIQTYAKKIGLRVLIEV